MSGCKTPCSRIDCANSPSATKSKTFRFVSDGRIQLTIKSDICPGSTLNAERPTLSLTAIFLLLAVFRSVRGLQGFKSCGEFFVKPGFADTGALAERGNGLIQSGPVFLPELLPLLFRKLPIGLRKRTPSTSRLPGHDDIVDIINTQKVARQPPVNRNTALYSAIVALMGDKVLTSGNKVAKLGEFFGLTQEQWAEIVGVHRGTLAAYKHRENANPTTKKLRRLSDIYGIPIGWFLDGVDDDPPIRKLNREEAIQRAEDGKVRPMPPGTTGRFGAAFSMHSAVALPVWRGVLAGNGEEAGLIEESGDPPEEVPAFFTLGYPIERFVVCLPSGVSMAPRVVQGDRIIVRLEDQPPPNVIVVARRPDNVNFIKVHRLNAKISELHSINDDFPVISPLRDWVMRGVVVGIWKPYITGDLNIEFNTGMPLRA